MTENAFELANYAIAESAANKEPVDGYSACATCQGCGLIPSDGTFASKDRRQTHCSIDDWKFSPMRIGVKVCPDCRGDGDRKRRRKKR